MSATAIRVPEPEASPQSFKEAIKAGWKIISEESKTVRGKRAGSATLGMEGRAERLIVCYFATREGYEFGSVKVLA